jgi:uncharacterized protein YjgD (DUF1641 family)
MANPIAFQPKPIDPRFELERRLKAAPVEHAESLLVAFDLLEEAHNQGILDLLHGAVGSKDAILGKLAEYARQPESVNAVRNLLILAKLLGSVEPEALKPAPSTEKAPSLWRIFQSMRSEDGRRGLARVTAILTAFGRAEGFQQTNRAQRATAPKD